MGNIEFESLVPTNSMDENKKTFIDALKWATSNTDNKNIAITGTYGAGKSSLIETFIKEEKLENETVKISIATFNQESINDAPQQVDTEIPIENILEQQILQQLFYKIEPNKIPLSQFTRFYDLDRFKTISTILFLLLMSILTYVIFKFDWLTNAYKGLISGDLNKTVLIAILALFLIVSYSYFIYLVILIFQKMGLSKFGLGNTSIEVVTKESNTVFNRYLDEIIYLFKQSKYKYVVFEDLDRFDNIGIYERLKGLNIILNGTKQLKGHNIIFIYALKDDLFISNDGKNEIYNRTKFFDFIIPTIKVVHSSNAENLLLDKLKTELVSETNTTGINKVFVEDISLFVNDMRTLINICNEYKIYKSALMNGGITSNNLLAFTVYKNIYPSDYSNLLNNQGKLYDFLNIKQEVIENLNKEIEVLKQKMSLEVISEEFNSQDIELLFYQKANFDQRINNLEVINSKNEVVEKISLNNSIHTIIKFNGLFEACLNLYEKGSKLKAIQSNNIYTYYGKEFFDDPGRMNFLERYKLVKLKEEKTSLQEKLDLLNDQLQKVKTKSISSLLEMDLLECSLLSEIKDNDELLYFLVRNGWIDESYEDYLSYFYEGSLSNNDVKMLKSIRNDLPPNYSLTLRNTHKVWEKIRLEDIQTSVIFNYDLFEQLLVKPSSYSEKLEKYIHVMFSKEFDQGIKFYLNYVEYLNQNENYKMMRNLLSIISNNDIDFISDVIEAIETKYKETYIYALINSWKYIRSLFNGIQIYTMKEIIDSMSPNQLFKDSNLKESSLLRDLQIQFIDITRVEDSEYKKFLIEEHRFKINIKNVSFLLEKVNYENATHNEIGEYIVDNKVEFFEDVILKLDNYEEDEITFVKILNDDDVEKDLKQKLIEKCSIRIENVENLNSIKHLILSNKVACNLKNLLQIITHEEYYIDDLNLDYIFKKQENIDEFSLSLENVDVTLYENLCNEIIKSEYINTDQLNEILKYSNDYLILSSDVIENINDNSLKNIIDQIKNDRIYWSKELYELLFNSNVNQNTLLRYLENAIVCAKGELTSDLIQLNEDQKLIWSEDVAEVLAIEEVHLETYFKQFSRDVPPDYFYSKINTFIPIISDLNFSWLTNDMNISYFTKLIDRGVNEDFLRNQISKINKWDINLFEVLRKKNNTHAINYAKNFELELKNIKITQEIFDFFVSIGLDDEVIINLYNFNSLEPSTDLLVWLLDEKNMKHFEKLHNKIKVLNNYSQQANISKIVQWYLKTKELTKSDVYELFSELHQPFSEVGIRKGNNKEIEYDEDTFSLFKYLEERGVIASMNKTDSNKIKFNNKRK
ncbi:hypothetical protein [Lysinibacillus sphaericus]|uniref:YobI family P-loop NTPase n=1 Tax=Lysinibacillus sphaericus TaxID=1421 RepID=UPI001910F435|nr:hypothetical protein [Lysinibacillus sphaericus]QPA53075.1 hypothetical protein INQ53_14470 [Lysinibacillus sphaericus]